MPKILASIGIALLLPSAALADCGWIGSFEFYTCENSIANSVGRALPTLVDSVRFNPGCPS